MGLDKFYFLPMPEDAMTNFISLSRLCMASKLNGETESRRDVMRVVGPIGISTIAIYNL